MRIITSLSERDFVFVTNYIYVCIVLNDNGPSTKIMQVGFLV